MTVKVDYVIRVSKRNGRIEKSIPTNERSLKAMLNNLSIGGWKIEEVIKVN